MTHSLEEFLLFEAFTGFQNEKIYEPNHQKCPCGFFWIFALIHSIWRAAEFTGNSHKSEIIDCVAVFICMSLWTAFDNDA